MLININGAEATGPRYELEKKMEDQKFNVEQKKQFCLEALKNGTIGREDAARMLTKLGVPIQEAINLTQNATKEETPNLKQTGANDYWGNIGRQISESFGKIFTKKSE